MPPQTLAKPLRSQLENTVKAARDIAETAARAAIAQLGVGEAKAPEHLDDEQKQLRRRLRAHGRQLGDSKHGNDTQETRRLVWETAYEHWHRMLFARFLAENHLLMWEPGAAVTLEECAELANDPDTNMGAKSGWELAGKLAARMLPQVFKARSPVLALGFAPEHQRELEKRLASLPAEVFQASDSLGWVYQFWQAKRKDEVNASEVKIGADELPAVTQLFTEPYMVDFLLHNSLGAWWMTRHPDKPCPVEFTYLRQIPVETAPSRLSEDGAAMVEAASSRLTRQDGAATTATLYGYLHDDEPIANLSGNLPHWRQEGVSYFVTFRTADSLPQVKLEQWQQEREAWLQQHPKPHDEATRREYHDRFTARIEYWLDQGYGECLLAHAQYKTIVENALRYFDRQRYHLGEFVVMPNHVHAIVTPLPGFELSDILHSWKSFTSNQINRLAGRTGTFWQKESFDQIIRSPAHLERVTLYIRENPKVFVETASSRLPRQDGAATVETASSRLPRQDGAATVETASSRSQRQDAAATEAAGSRFYPAAGKFEGWPDRLAEFTLLDPCCGSGHFLVAAFLLLVPMRMAAEGLSARQAVDAVLRDNLHGLELDARCVELAAFALALAAWKYPNLPAPSGEEGANLPSPSGRGAGGEGEPLGYRELPKLNIACCGLAVTGKEADWLALAGEDDRLQRGMKALYDAFQDAPLLGSLIDPQRAAGGDLITADFTELAPLLAEALAKESEVVVETASSRLQRQDAAATTQEELSETAIAAQGLAEAARLLDRQYHLVITNVPYLTRGKQSEKLKKFCETHYSHAKNDLANVFLERCLELCESRSSGFQPLSEKAPRRRFYGVVQIVMPQNWLFLTSYEKQRKYLLKHITWNLLARLGVRAFETISGEVVNVILLTLTKSTPNMGNGIIGINELDDKNVFKKSKYLAESELIFETQHSQLMNPQSRVTLSKIESNNTIGDLACALQGIKTGDDGSYIRKMWEISTLSSEWKKIQSTVDSTCEFGGASSILRWIDNGVSIARLQGQAAWGKPGIAISLMSEIRASLFFGDVFDSNISIIYPRNKDNLSPIWCFCSSDIFSPSVKEIERGVKANNGALTKVPFELEHWQQVAAERYPNGLPKPYSDDPTQWIFHGHPQSSTDPLQVAVARLLGYTWPAETPSPPTPLPEGEGSQEMELSDEAHAWIAQAVKLATHADDDGIVCLPPLRGEKSAAERLLNLLIDAWETVEPGSWKASILAKLLAEADCAGKTLEVWLRDKFFEQHCKRFHHRPFIWHVWDGQKDGFAALVNYHKLDAKNLERLIHTYLGDWIRLQEQGAKDNADGADTRLAAAKNLQQRLQLILEGEPPYDIFVRWKPLAEQPIGWNPDLNDGVRLNIRPFIKGEVLRHNKPPKLNIKWDKDRGKDVASAPWFHLFKGERINDHHLTLAEKRRAKAE